MNLRLICPALNHGSWRALGVSKLSPHSGHSCRRYRAIPAIATSEARRDVDELARRLARLGPARVLIGDVPRLIDEWQLEQAIWNHVRRAMDDRAYAREDGVSVIPLGGP